MAEVGVVGVFSVDFEAILLPIGFPEEGEGNHVALAFLEVGVLPETGFGLGGAAAFVDDVVTAASTSFLCCC